MKRKLNVKKVVVALTLFVGIMFALLFTIDKYRFNSYIEGANNSYTLEVNGVSYSASEVVGKEFWFNDQTRKVIDLQVPKGSVLNLPENYTLTNSNGEVVAEEITYLADGSYLLVVEKDGYKLEYDLVVDNDFSVEIDSTNAYKSGYVVVDFFDLNDSEEITIDTSFNTSDYFMFREQDLLVPIKYDSEIGMSTIKFTSQLSTLETQFEIKYYEFRESRFNVDLSVIENSSKEPDPIVVDLYEEVTKNLSKEVMYTPNFVNPAVGRRTGDFGDIRFINGEQTPSRYHYGLDYANVANTPIYPTNTGKVIFVNFLPATGNMIVIDHGNGIFSRYLHLNEMYASVGDVVTTDTVIAGMGTTGYSTGVHLHFEIQINGVIVNPYLFLNQVLNFN